MTIIKRYPNRKLYNTETKQYITLDGIASLIQDGDEVQIIDHTSGDDLTTLTLSQIIFEQEKKQSGFLPKNVLTGLVRAGGDTLSSLGRSLVAPLGIMADVNKIIEKRISDLIRRGELAEEEGLKLLDKLLFKHNPNDAPQDGFEADHDHSQAESYVEKMLAKRGIPTKEDMVKLSDQLDVLTQKIEEIDEKKSS